MSDSYLILPIEIDLQSPVIIPNNEGDENITLSEDFITGSAILGLFAGKNINSNPEIKKKAHTDPVFSNYFLSDDFIFTNAYKLTPDNQFSIPLPFSIQSPKTDKKKIVDKLFVQEESKDKHEMENEPIQNEPEITKPLNAFGCLKIENNICYIVKVPVEKAKSLHHQRTDQKVGSSQDEIIYNYEYLLPNQSFGGFIIGPKEKIENSNKFWDGSEFSGRLGKSKSNEYGHVTIKKISEPFKVTDKNAQFTSIFFKSITLDKNKEFTLTFLSPVILKNENGYSTVSTDELKNYLSRQLGFKPKPDEITINSFIRTIDVENYVSVWKAKKPSDTAFAAGCCFKIQINCSNDQFTNIQAALEKMQITGIGSRRNEGFGRIAVNLQQKFKNYSEQKLEGADNIAPSFPEAALKSIIENVFLTEIQTATKSLALDWIDKFTNIPSNSLLSRLQNILRSSKFETAITDINRFADPAKEALKKCTSPLGKSLYTLLTEAETYKTLDVKIKEKITQKYTNQKQENELIQLGLKIDDYYQSYYQLFFLTLFNLMQRKNKE